MVAGPGGRRGELKTLTRPILVADATVLKTLVDTHGEIHARRVPVQEFDFAAPSASKRKPSLGSSFALR